jgi:Flp pilus assembly pilin Flp
VAAIAAMQELGGKLNKAFHHVTSKMSSGEG